MRLTRERATRGNNVTFGNFTWSDDFTSKKLQPEWLMLWGDASAYCKTGKGGLRLQCRPYTFKEAATPAYVGRRLQHHRFTVEADMEFTPNATSSAGLMLVKNGARQYYLARNSKGVTLWQIKNGKRQAMGFAELPTKDKKLTMRVTSNGTVFSFSVQHDGQWLNVADNVDASFLSTRYAGGFTGTTIGMYAEE